MMEKFIETNYQNKKIRISDKAGLVVGNHVGLLSKLEFVLLKTYRKTI